MNCLSFSEEELIQKLLDNPNALYLLYQLNKTGFDCNLPTFIDRAKEVNFLKDLGIIEFISEKKIHYRATKFTKKGNSLYKKLDKKGIFTAFYNISLDSEFSFKEYYYEKIKRIEEEIKFPESVIYRILIKYIKGINIWFKIGNYEILIKDLKPLEISEDYEIWSIDFEFICNICKQKSENHLEIKYDIDNINRNPRRIHCDKCKAIYMLCPFLNCFYGL